MNDECKHELEHLRLDKVSYDFFDPDKRKIVAYFICFNCHEEVTKEKEVAGPCFPK